MANGTDYTLEETIIQQAKRIQGLERLIRELENSRKEDCCSFFRWFSNQPGTNVEQGYDQWVKERD